MTPPAPTRPLGRRLLSIGLALAAAAALAPAASAAPEFPDSYYYYSSDNPRRAAHLQLEGKPAPEVKLGQWYGEKVDLKAMKGKVVVLDFWATWCPPCRKAIPKNIEMVNKYKDQGLVFVGIHDSNRGKEGIEKMMESRGFNYPVAVNAGAVQDYRVRFWPTYAVIDREGVLRAVGLRPEKVEAVVRQILSEDGGPAKKKANAAPSVDLSKFGEGDARQRARLASIDHANPPEIAAASGWMNSESLSLERLKGKVVVLDFWATWCGPCMRAIPHTNEMMEKYGDKVVIIGVCAPRGGEKMAETARARGIRYPICLDQDGSLARNYAVNGFPDYYIIDQQGRLVLADCSNGSVERAIEALLAEG